MGLVLIHIDPMHGPIGAWRVTHDRRYGDELTSYYRPRHAVRAGRAYFLLGIRDPQVSLDDWLAELCIRLPARDDFECVEADPGLPLAEVLAEVAAAWRHPVDSYA